MSEISCRVFEFFERNAVQHGYSLASLVEGVGAPLSVLQNPAERVPWEVWVSLSERFESLVGGAEQTILAGEQIIDMGFAGPIRTIGGALLAPERVYEAVVRWLGPYLFRNLIWSVTRLEDGHLLIDIEVPAHQPASPAWFRMAQGAFATVPQAVAAGRALVIAEIDGRHARFEVRCATKTTFLARFRIWIRALTRPAQLLDQISELQVDLRAALKHSLASQHELRRVLMSVPDPVAVVRDEQLIWTNSAWQDLLGERMPIDLSARYSDNLIHIDHVGQRAFELALPVAITWEARAAQLVLLRDVTQVRQVAEHMRIADRLSALGMVAASVGHEINNPLAVALGSLELALADVEDIDDKLFRENLERAIEGISQAAGVTSDLLTVARDTGDLEPVEVGDAIDVALRLARNEIRHVSGLEVEVDVAESLAAVRGSRQGLTQVVLNLLVNAVHAVAEQESAEHHVTLRAANANGFVIIDVEDSGPGIPAALLADVKEPFFTTKGRRGSGLGLAVCERIVSEYGGSLELVSLPNGGTRARVSLRAIPNKTENRGRTALVHTSRPLRILVVDDEEAIGGIVSRLLPAHEVVALESAEQALELLARDDAFDVLLLDVMLMGSSGLELRDALPQALRPKVVFMTGGVFLQDGASQLDEQNTTVLAKPFAQEALEQAVLAVAQGRDSYQDSA